VSEKYFDSAKNLGIEMVKAGFNLVYGGANRGLMGAVADSVKKEGGGVTGVIPKALKKYGIAREGLDELIVTDDMRERKSVMERKSDGFIFMPAGVGTIEEAMEILTLKQLHYHNKPLVFLNTLNYYSLLFRFFEKMEKEKFIKKELCTLFHVAKNGRAAVGYIKRYKPSKLKDKWF
jgi:uncharacterized protein (TIGR00730 family)